MAVSTDVPRRWENARASTGEELGPFQDAVASADDPKKKKGRKGVRRDCSFLGRVLKRHVKGDTQPKKAKKPNHEIAL